MKNSRIDIFYACCLLLACTFFSTTAIAQPFVINEYRPDYGDINKHVQAFTDSTGNIKSEDITSGRCDSFFMDLSKLPNKLSHRFSHWGRVSLANHLDRDLDLMLVLAQNNYADVYVALPDGTFEARKAGFFDRISEKEVPEGREGKAKILLKSGDTTQIYYRVQSISHFRPKLHASLKLESAFHEEIKGRNLFQGLFSGILGIMFLYNLLLFMQSRDRTYLYYSIYILSGLTYWLSYAGFIREYLITDWIKPWQILWVLAIALSPVFYILFMRDFLNTPQLLPKWDRLFKWSIWAMLAGLSVQVLLFFTTFNLSLISEISIIQTLLSYAFLLLCLIVIGRTRNTLAYYFLIGSVTLWIGVFVGTALLYFVHKGEGASFAPWSQAGLASEVLLFSLGLGYRMRRNEEDKRKAQEDLIEQLKANEELQQRANRELERKVRERTAEIEQQKEEIQAQRDNIGLAYQEITLQKNLIEKKNQDITASITYAKRIQSAILPPESRIKEALSQESFVIFQPRDIVSGDFYWFSDKMANGMKAIAAVDCTGHGVPGAIMSMIGNDLLNEAIHLKGITNPAAILHDMSISVRERLRQEDATSIRDSMDMALCIVDGDRLHFAGAKMPLFYVQKGLLHEVKADKHPIGGEKAKGDLIFETQTIQIEGDTMVYLLSDGYQDQFGGPEGRKFMKGRLKALLQEIHQLPAAVQKAKMEKELALWQGQHKRIDDVMVVGFKL